MGHFSLLLFSLCRQNIQAGLVLHRGYNPENFMKFEHKIPLYNSVFPGCLGTDNLILYSV